MCEGGDGTILRLNQVMTTIIYSNGFSKSGVPTVSRPGFFLRLFRDSHCR